MQGRHSGEWHRIYKLNRCRERNTMDFLKELFTQPLSFEDFVKAVTEKGYKLADLSKGDYVAKGKLDEANGKIKTLTDDIGKLNNDITDLQNSNASAEEYKKKFEELQKKVNADNEAAEKARADAELTTAIEAVFGDRKFTSEYAKQGLIADMKSEIAKDENKGKGYAEIFEAFTKDKEGIFANPNQPANMAGMGKVDTNTNTNNMRAIMGLAPTKE